MTLTNEHLLVLQPCYDEATYH